jgi:hypothetical protein
VFKLIQCKAKFWIVYELFTESSILMHSAHSLLFKFMCVVKHGSFYAIDSIVNNVFPKFFFIDIGKIK